jgi:hypothetical protein
MRTRICFLPAFKEIGIGSLRLHGSPRKRRDSSGDSSQQSHLPRSMSESNLIYGQCTPSRKRMIHTSRPQNNTVIIPGTNNMIMSYPFTQPARWLSFLPMIQIASAPLFMD